MRRAAGLVALIFGSLLVLNACGSDNTRHQTTVPTTPVVTTLPLSPALNGVASLQLPATPEGIVALLSQLPSEIAGKQRNASSEAASPDRYTAEYGEARGGVGPPLRLVVLNVATGDFFPKDWTGARMVDEMAKGGDWEVTGSGKDGSVAWVRYVTTESGGGASFDVYAIHWAQGDSPWVFGIVADSAQNADAFLAAFVASAQKAYR